MDPNATLAELRALVKDSHDVPGDYDSHTVNRGERALELFEALDEWITGGGFFPREWLGRVKRDKPPASLVWEESHDATAADWARKFKR